jgi:hypothetical protein
MFFIERQIYVRYVSTTASLFTLVYRMMTLCEIFKENYVKELMKFSSSNIVFSAQQNHKHLNASGSCGYDGVQMRYWNDWSLNYGEIFNTKSMRLSLFVYRKFSNHFIDRSASSRNPVRLILI